MEKFRAMQECNCCGKKFWIEYRSDGTYEYLDDACDCEDGFSPAPGFQSIAEWMETLKGSGARTNRVVKCLETGAEYTFTDKTPYEAMEAMRYTLNLKRKDETATINKTCSGMHLWMDHGGFTYSVRND